METLAACGGALSGGGVGGSGSGSGSDSGGRRRLSNHHILFAVVVVAVRRRRRRAGRIVVVVVVVVVGVVLHGRRGRRAVFVVLLEHEHVHGERVVEGLQVLFVGVEVFVGRARIIIIAAIEVEGVVFIMTERCALLLMILLAEAVAEKRGSARAERGVVGLHGSGDGKSLLCEWQQRSVAKGVL